MLEAISESETINYNGVDITMIRFNLNTPVYINLQGATFTNNGDTLLPTAIYCILKNENIPEGFHFTNDDLMTYRYGIVVQNLTYNYWYNLSINYHESILTNVYYDVNYRGSNETLQSASVESSHIW